MGKKKKKNCLNQPLLLGMSSVFLVDLACWHPRPEHAAPLSRLPWQPGFESFPPCSDVMRKRYPAVSSKERERSRLQLYCSSSYLSPFFSLKKKRKGLLVVSQPEMSLAGFVIFSPSVSTRARSLAFLDLQS